MLRAVAEEDVIHPGSGQRVVKRHSFVVRATHWVNVLCLTMLLMSGLQIFNARPQLDFGQKTDFDHPPFAISSSEVNGGARGFVRIGSHRFDTTGVLCLSTVDGQSTERAFPAWATLPSAQDLATGRAIHFVFAWLFVANGLIYLIWGFATGHFGRDFVPSGRQWRHIGGSILEHARLRFPKGEEARQYNVLQKITYFIVAFLLLPVLVLAGWTMSPGLDAQFPFLLDIFGGRQTARSVHFLAAFGVVLFVLIHVALVLVSGVFNNMRSMITGWYDIGREDEIHG
jgi:thiosulfate reductase cytochrome b subunit